MPTTPEHAIAPCGVMRIKNNPSAEIWKASTDKIKNKIVGLISSNIPSTARINDLNMQKI